MSLTTVDAGLLGTQAQYTGFKNRIINGAMVIDQRNNGASVTASTTGAATYTVDRWAYYTSQASKFSIAQGSTTPPAGFKNYLALTVGASANVTVGSSDYFFMTQRIEGLNIADFNWGLSTATSITLSFWVRSSLTGTFGGVATNGSFSYSYPFTYVVNSANTWEQKTITIVGPTSGTWAIDNTDGIQLNFAIGLGSTQSGPAGSWSANGYNGANGCVNLIATNSATWQVTGVQLEKGSTATSFDYRPYGTELNLCLRYYWRWSCVNNAYIYISTAGRAYSTTNGTVTLNLPVPMRTGPATNNSNNFTGTNWDYAVTAITINNGGYEAFPYTLANINVVGTFPGSERIFALGSGGSTTSTIWIEFTAEL
jgi:hypothetical protein